MTVFIQSGVIFWLAGILAWGASLIALRALLELYKSAFLLAIELGRLADVLSRNEHYTFRTRV